MKSSRNNHATFLFWYPLQQVQFPDPNPGPEIMWRKMIRPESKCLSTNHETQEKWDGE